MGCFNTIKIPCDNCDHVMEFQSKAGDCNLAEFPLRDAPLRELGDVVHESEEGRLICPECKHRILVFVQKIIQVEAGHHEDHTEEDDECGN